MSSPHKGNVLKSRVFLLLRRYTIFFLNTGVTLYLGAEHGVGAGSKAWTFRRMLLRKPVPENKTVTIWCLHGFLIGVSAIQQDVFDPLSQRASLSRGCYLHMPFLQLIIWQMHWPEETCISSDLVESLSEVCSSRIHLFCGFEEAWTYWLAGHAIQHNLSEHCQEGKIKSFRAADREVLILNLYLRLWRILAFKGNGHGNFGQTWLFFI